MPVKLPASLLLALAIALPALTLILGLPSRPAILGVLNDFAHGPVFALFAVVVALALRERFALSGRVQFAVALAVAVCVSGLIEAIQPALGRDGSIQDWLTSCLGAAGGLAALAFARTTRRWLPALVLAISIAAVCWPVLEAAFGYLERGRQAPALLELSGRSDMYFLSFGGVRVATSPLPKTWRRAGDPSSLRLKFTELPRRYVSHLEPLADWRPFQSLRVDATNPGSVPLVLTIRVHDSRHNNQASDRFNLRFRLSPASRQLLVIPLADVVRAPHGRRLDIGEIAGWTIFADHDADVAGREVYLTRVWLE
jgi:hypothetical protein